MVLVSSRRTFITGLVSLLATPAIVRATSIMPIKALVAEPFMAFGSPGLLLAYNGIPEGSLRFYGGARGGGKSALITREAVRLFTESNVFLQQLNRQYDGAFASGPSRIGSQLQIRLPSDWSDA